MEVTEDNLPPKKRKSKIEENDWTTKKEIKPQKMMKIMKTKKKTGKKLLLVYMIY